MTFKHHQNAILTGCVDALCLVCKTHLRSEEDAITHIGKPVHLKNLTSCPYLKNFAGDHIRKVKKGYYCEFCNLLLPTAAKVGLHVTDEGHNESKKKHQIKRFGSNVVIFENILISEQAWNGLIEDTCAVCNIEFHNIKLHVADPKHVLNLIQKEVEFADKNTVYRKIDDGSFHCLICNSMFALNSVENHSNVKAHSEKFDKCRKDYKDHFENKPDDPLKSTENDKDEKKLVAQNKLSKNIEESSKINENLSKNVDKCRKEDTKFEDDKTVELAKSEKTGTDHNVDNTLHVNNVTESKSQKSKKSKKKSKIAKQIQNTASDTKTDTKIYNESTSENNKTDEPSKSIETDKDYKKLEAHNQLSKNFEENFKNNKDLSKNVDKCRKDDTKLEDDNTVESPKSEKTSTDDKKIDANNQNIDNTSHDISQKSKKSKKKSKIANQAQNTASDIKPDTETLKESTSLNSITEKSGKGLKLNTPTAVSTPTEMESSKPVNIEINQNQVKDQNNNDNDCLFEDLIDFQKKGVNIDFEMGTAFCKKCFESVDLDIKAIKQHINEHKISPKKEITPNTVHTMNPNHSRTVLSSRDIDEEYQTINKPTMKYDLNHIPKNEAKEKSTREEDEEIIKIDLTRRHEGEDEETTTNKALTIYIPGAAKSEPQNPTEKPANELDMNDPGVFAKENNITYNDGVGNAYCRTCSTRIPSAIKSMKEHVGGMPHKTKLARIVQTEKASKVIPKRAMEKFIEEMSTVRSIFGNTDVVIINDIYCLTRMSFNMITMQSRLRCQLCELNLNKDEVSRHIDGIFHKRALIKTPVVTNLKNEFIREVRRDIYHCGFCNLVVGVWADMQQHLQCAEHGASCRAAADQCSELLPGIMSHRQQLLYEALFERFMGF